MRVVLQRVLAANVTVDSETIGNIGPGWLALVGVQHSDTPKQAHWLADKITGLRAFADDDGKMNRSVQDIGGSVLVVSNFTLYADCQKGRRPSFIRAARPEEAEPLIRLFVEALRSRGVPVSEGRFGADMRVELVNDGPVTLVIDSADEN